MRRALVLTFALVAAACGGEAEGEGDVATDVWVRDVCTTLTDWNDRVQSRTGTLQTDLQGLPQGDFQALKDLMVSYIDGVIEDTDQAVTSLEGAGAPAVEDGGEASRLVVRGIGEVRTIFEQAREDIAALDASRPRRFAMALQDIGLRVQQGGQQVQATFQEVDQRGIGGEELDQAFDEEPACAPLAGGAGP
ncbi:MAG TPA: hypothetical protein VF097_00095 [Actinomycetota bacterium]